MAQSAAMKKLAIILCLACLAWARAPQTVDPAAAGWERQSQNVTINLAPGSYQFICRFHVSLGMKGTLTITG